LEIPFEQRKSVAAAMVLDLPVLFLSDSPMEQCSTRFGCFLFQTEAAVAAPKPLPEAG